jgi:uncharacterized protein
VIVYAESSAVLSWLLGEPAGSAICGALQAAEFVVTSDLTLVECDRALHRAHSIGQLPEDRRAELASELRRIASGWILLRLSDEIVERARGTFPGEPIRSLDALHLASALTTVALVPETAILTLDRRVRNSGLALQLTLLAA